MAATAIEAKDRADESNEVIGLFGLLKLLKDPQAQKMFRFRTHIFKLVQNVTINKLTYNNN